MSDAPVQVTYRVHAVRRQQAIVLEAGPLAASPGRVPRVARLVALTHHFERPCSPAAPWPHRPSSWPSPASRSGVSQKILNLSLRSSDLQKALGGKR